MIKFGTSGWRGIIADDFTFDNVKLVTQAISDYIKTGCSQAGLQQMKSVAKAKKAECSKAHVARPLSPAVIVGYDTRFHSENFAKISSTVLAANGIKVFLTKRDCPTPVISYEILRQKIDGGLNFTASHNPAEYNGLKFSPSWGGPALPETTDAIEKKLQITDYRLQRWILKREKEKI
ncbi:MAG: hypothetical protein ABID79_04105 [Elusimicrobiota bacterium]